MSKRDGTSANQQDQIMQCVGTVTQWLRRGATVELEGRRPVAELAGVSEGLAHQKADVSGSAGMPDDER